MRAVVFAEYDLVVHRWGVLMIALSQCTGRLVEVAVDRSGDGYSCLVRGSVAAEERRLALRAEQKSRARTRRGGRTREETLAIRAARERARTAALRPAPAPVAIGPRKKSPSALAREAWSRRGRG